MKNILIIVVCLTILGCEAVATLFHGEKPEPPAVIYTVTFDANGAVGNPPAEQAVKAGDVISLPNIGGMVNAGNTFVGWSESATIGVGTTLFVDDSITVTRDIVFYAQWISIGSTQYTISFNANGASGAPPPSRIVYTGVQIRIPDQGSLGYTGRMFGGWNTEADGSGTLFGSGALHTFTGSIVLYAQWFSSTDSFTVTFDANGASGTVSSPQTVNANTNITLPGGGGLSKDGFIFGGWNVNAEGTGDNYSAGFLYTVTGNITLYAKWNSFFANAAEVSAYLALQSGGFDPNEPVYLPVQMNLGTMTQSGSGWRQLLNVIANSGRYVALDLSQCSMNGTEFNPEIYASIYMPPTPGADMIVSLILPDIATSISGCGGFTELRSFNGIGLTSIGEMAFYYGCINLSMTSLPETITTIGGGAFAYCTSLELTDLPPKLTYIGGTAFAYCSNLAITNLILPDGITVIEHMTFIGTNIELVTLPAGLEYINEIYNNFGNCTQLTILATNPPHLANAMYDVSFQIKVPAGSVEAYKAAPGWSHYADRISAIE